MLKWCNYNLLNEPKKYFNFVLDSEYYPENWNHGIVYAIYKSGPKDHLFFWKTLLHTLTC